MARATYRKRPDGLYEIVRPRFSLPRLEALLMLASAALGLGAVVRAVVAPLDRTGAADTVVTINASNAK